MYFPIISNKEALGIGLSHLPGQRRLFYIDQQVDHFEAFGDTIIL